MMRKKAKYGSKVKAKGGKVIPTKSNIRKPAPTDVPRKKGADETAMTNKFKRDRLQPYVMPEGKVAGNLKSRMAKSPTLDSITTGSNLMTKPKGQTAQQKQKNNKALLKASLKNAAFNSAKRRGIYNQLGWAQDSTSKELGSKKPTAVKASVTKFGKTKTATPKTKISTGTKIKNLALTSPKKRTPSVSSGKSTAKPTNKAVRQTKKAVRKTKRATNKAVRQNKRAVRKTVRKVKRNLK
jgi:colicin import membrane protein